MRQDAFGGRAPPRPAGGATLLPQTQSLKGWAAPRGASVMGIPLQDWHKGCYGTGYMTRGLQIIKLFFESSFELFFEILKK